MKKLLALICMITCVFGLTACGNEEVLTEYEQQKVNYAKQMAANGIIPVVLELTGEARQEELAEYTSEEIEFVIASDYGLSVDGYAVINAVASFESALESMGSVVGVGETSAEIDGDQIVVYVQVQGENKDAEAEIIFSNDLFMTLKSAALNPVSTMGDLMGKAALNTLIGMGTVFVILILISMLISCFAFIPKIQAKLKKKDKKNDAEATGIDNAVAHIVGQEEADASDDLELVAVIAAAIAASEGAASTDGFVVRSIRKVNRGRR